MIRHTDIKVTGKVTGVGFRFYAMQAAYRYEIKGTVKNMPDKSLVIEAEGEEQNLENFLNWCRRGPVGARVELVQTANGPLKNYSSFEILRSSSGS